MKLTIFKLMFIVFFVWIVVIVAKQWPDEYVHLIFCDVGQGDAILITYSDKQMLIDGGPNEKVLSCLENNMPFWDKSIELLVITHMDYDHIGGLPSVLSRYSVDIILKNLSIKKTDGFKALNDAVSRESENGANVISSRIGQKFMLGSLVESTVVSPQVNFPLLEEKNMTKTETTLSDTTAILEEYLGNNIIENDLSIGLFITINDVRLLLTGDMEKKSELALIKSGMIGPIDILKVGHHGSESSSSRQFISILRPEISVISSGKNNQYNHPSSRVVDLLNEFKSDIYRTDIQGTIEFVTNGTKYWRSI